ncbi:MAG: PD-(D/E)XK nuclease family protein [Fimbriimonadaceae bacterium]|nr:PD-(D/E)XK nuclease family protein [Fimbriimonadaceae bacterium]
MPQSRLGVLVAPPGGHGLAEALRTLVARGAVVTSWSDPLLVAARAAWTEGLDGSIFTWGDWVRRLAQHCGLPAPRIPTRGHQRALVSLASRHLGEETPFQRTCRMSGAHFGLVSVLSELRSWSLDAPRLRNAAEGASEELADRLRVLATLDELVRDSLDAAGLGFAAEIVKAIMAEGAPKAWPCEDLIVLAGLDPHPVYEAFLTWMASEGLHVTVVVEAIPGSDRLFASGRALIERLRVKPKPGLGPSWHEALFRGVTVSGGPNLTSIAAPDRLAEAEWALRLSLEREFASPEETTLVASEIGTYGPLIQSASKRLAVPVSASLPAPLASSGLVKFLTGLLQALATRSPSFLGRVVLEDYLGGAASNPQDDSLPSKWEDAVEWSLQGNGSDWLRVAFGWLEAAPALATLREWHSQFHLLVGELLSSAGSADPGVEGGRDLRSMTLVQRSIAEYAFAYDIAGEANLDLVGFLRLAEDLWAAETVMLPSPPGGVPVVSTPWAVGAVETVVALGCVEGSFPKGAKQDPVLLDPHREELARLEGCYLLTSQDAARAERDAFVRLCGSARSKLVLSRPKRDGERNFVPSVYVVEAMRTLSGTEWEPPGLAIPEESAVLQADLKLGEALAGPRTGPVEPRLMTDQAHQAVAVGESSALDVDQIGDYVRCPLRAAFRHRLSVRQRGRLGSHVLLDIPVRAGLVAIQDMEEARERLKEALEARIGELATRAMPHESALLRAVGRRWIESWLGNEGRTRGAWPRTGVEGRAEFGTGRLKGTIRIAEDVSVRLQGAVGSIVEADGTIRVVLFKSRELDTRSSDADKDADAARRAVIALAAFRKGDAAVFEMDYLDKGRVIEPYAKVSLTYRGGPGQRVQGGPDHDLYRSLQAAAANLRGVVGNMRAGALRPQPGDHCRTCGITELCRWSQDEQNDRFAGGNG